MNLSTMTSSGEALVDALFDAYIMPFSLQNFIDYSLRNVLSAADF